MWPCGPQVAHSVSTMINTFKYAEVEYEKPIEELMDWEFRDAGIAEPITDPAELQIAEGCGYVPSAYISTFIYPQRRWMNVQTPPGVWSREFRPA